MNRLIALLRRFTIRLRMLGAIGMVVSMFLVIGAGVIAAGSQVRQMFSDFMQHSVHEMETVSELRQHMAQVRLAEKQMLIDYEDGIAVLKQRELWAAELKAARQSLNGLLEGEEDEDNAHARQAVQHLDAYVKATESVLQNVQNGGYDSIRGAQRAFETSRRHAEGIAAEIEQVARIVKGEVAERRADFEAVMKGLLLGLGGVLALALFIVAPLTMLNSASITRPIAYARQVAQSIAAGDLTRPIRLEGRDEAADLMAALQTMQDNLARMVGEVRSSSGHIEANSTEVASGNADLADRTRQASGSLKHTAGSMTQLAVTVNQTAASAQTATQLAASAADVAQRGGQVVSEVVSTMNEINVSSRRIGDIIGTIDSIAFQTNILALNAAVEAARAGEQGRGFAVVAGEVRSLAQRSAAAAREIKGLIGSSVERVDLGARLVADAGETMQEIVASVQRVSRIIQEISAAAAEQSSGLGAISANVSEIDRVTQQNSDLVQNSAQTADALKEQAQRLSGLVAAFRIGPSG